MHAAMQPREEGGAGEPPPGLRPHLVAPATWVGPPGHHLRVVGCALGPDPPRGYGWVQFIFGGLFSIGVGLRLF